MVNPLIKLRHIALLFVDIRQNTRENTQAIEQLSGRSVRGIGKLIVVVNGKKFGCKRRYEQFEILTAQLACVANVGCGEEREHIID